MLYDRPEGFLDPHSSRPSRPLLAFGRYSSPGRLYRRCCHYLCPDRLFAVANVYERQRLFNLLRGLI